jgi:Flavodoxin
MNKKVLIIYYTETGSTLDVATLLATHLSNASVKDIKEDPDVSADFIILCTPNKYGKPVPPVIRFIKKYYNQLADIPVSICFTCMDCYDFPENERQYPCKIYKDSYFSSQEKEMRLMNKWEKDHSVMSYIQSVNNVLPPASLHSIAFFKGNLSFKKLSFFDSLIMRFISFINPKIKPGYYLNKEDVIRRARELSN